MPFYNREREKRQLKAILSGEPNLVYFVYGPINSGKTALLTKVFEELPQNYIIFYLNFRGIYIGSIEDLLQVLFEVKVGEYKEEVKEIVKEVLKESAKTFRKNKGIPIPESLFDRLFSGRKIENIFRYLESLFEEVKEKRKTPIFVLDEIQTVRNLMNATGRLVIHELFNFLVRLTKEAHLCHCLCSTSDCLFIEEIYSNARLEGRARYILIDDLMKEEAFKVYESFGFREKELVWNYIGGKIGDMIRLYDGLKEGFSEEEALEQMLREEVGRLKWLRKGLKEGFKEGPEWIKVEQTLKKFLESEILESDAVSGDELLFLIRENIVFYNPLNNTVRFQSRLIHRAIKELV